MSIGIGTSTTSGNVGIGTVKQPSTSSFSTSGTVGSSACASGVNNQQLKSNTSSSTGSNGSSGMPWYIKLLRKLDKDK